MSCPILPELGKPVALRILVLQSNQIRLG
ncbi:Hypothetical leucine rich repeat protein (Partial), partial [Ectocarpus siliculosus]